MLFFEDVGSSGCHVNSSLSSKQVETAARCKSSYMMLLRFKLPNLPLQLSYPMDRSCLGAFPTRMIMIKWAKRLQNMGACDVRWFKWVWLGSAVERKHLTNDITGIDVKAGNDVSSFLLKPPRTPISLEADLKTSTQLAWWGTSKHSHDVCIHTLKLTEPMKSRPSRKERIVIQPSIFRFCC